MQKLNVSWHGYSDHLREMMHGMMKNSDLTDVTLVCDDQKLLMAHKVVLSASSPVFQNIISNFSHNHSMIYLRGIKHEEMECILEFMYLGEATFHQERMAEFLKVAQNLGIKELTEMDEAIENEEVANVPNDMELNFRTGEESKEKRGEQNIESTEVTSLTKSYKSDDESFNIWQEKAKDVKKEINVKDSESRKINLKVKKDRKSHSYNKTLNKTCQDCGKSFKTPSKMMRHFTSVHQGLRPFTCTVCEKSYGQKEHLNLHVKNAHETTELNF